MARVYRPAYPAMRNVKGPDGKNVYVERVCERGRHKGRTVRVPLREPVIGNDGKPVYRELAHLAVEISYRDRLVTVSGFRDKKATEELARKLERLASIRMTDAPMTAELHRWTEAQPIKIRKKLAAVGLLDSRNLTAGKSARGHVADYKRALQNDGRTDRHAALTAKRIETVLDGIKAVFLGDVTPDAVKQYLADRRAKDNLSNATCNHYIVAFKGFFRWLVREGRLHENPVIHLSKLNDQTDRRHDRRALTDDEIARLLEAAEGGPKRLGIEGRDRAILYKTAAMTGLRSRELRSLTVGSFALSGDAPTVTVAAAYSKRRRSDTQPIPTALATELRSYFGMRLPTATAFRMPSPSNVVRMLRGDLEAAREAWIEESNGDDQETQKRRQSSYLRYRDDRGLVADFHSLRHYYVTSLQRAGIHPKTAQQLARHSTITLTMDRYTHGRVEDLTEAVAAIPGVSAKPNRKRQVANATDGAVCTPDILPDIWANRSKPVNDSQNYSVSPMLEQTCACDLKSSRSADFPEENGALLGTGNDSGLLGRGGLEPPTHGFSVRCGPSTQPVNEQRVTADSVPAEKPDISPDILEALQNSPEMAALLTRWNTLPEHRRRAILDLAGLGDEA